MRQTTIAIGTALSVQNLDSKVFCMVLKAMSLLCFFFKYCAVHAFWSLLQYFVIICVLFMNVSSLPPSRHVSLWTGIVPPFSQYNSPSFVFVFPLVYLYSCICISISVLELIFLFGQALSRLSLNTILHHKVICICICIFVFLFVHLYFYSCSWIYICIWAGIVPSSQFSFINWWESLSFLAYSGPFGPILAILLRIYALLVHLL